MKVLDLKTYEFQMAHKLKANLTGRRTKTIKSFKNQ